MADNLVARLLRNYEPWRIIRECAALRIEKLEAEVARLTREKDSATHKIDVIWEHHGIWMKRATAAEARVDRLEKALQPFAMMADRYTNEAPDSHFTENAVSLGDLRRARAALDDTSETKVVDQ